MSGRRAVFFDRDGTLMEEVDYCSDPAKVKAFAGVPEALGELKQAGFLAIIVTNQSGIGRGLFTEAQFRAVEDELLRQIGPRRIDASYFCADLPTAPTDRRKPAPGMILEAAAAFGVDLAESFMIGDKGTDVECGRRAGTRTILVRTGYGAGEERAGGFAPPNFVADDVPEAVRWLLRQPATAGQAV